MSKEEFCLWYHISEDQFYGREIIYGGLTIKYGHKLPENMNLIINGDLFILANELPSNTRLTSSGLIYLIDDIKIGEGVKLTAYWLFDIKTGKSISNVPYFTSDGEPTLIDDRFIWYGNSIMNIKAKIGDDYLVRRSNYVIGLNWFDKNFIKDDPNYEE